MQCEYVHEVTQSQEETLRIVTEHVKKTFESLRDTNPYEKTWKVVLEQWNGKILLGTRLHVPMYKRETGCITIGLGSNGSMDLIPRLVGRCILRITKETVGNSNCSQMARVAIDKAIDLGIDIDLSCDDIKEYSMVDTPWYSKKRCDTDAYDKRRWTFEELIGRDVDDAVEMLRNGYPDLHIVLRKWDMLHQTGTYDVHPEKETVVISYDMKSNKVVLPEPRITSMQNMDGIEGHCFGKPDDDQRCIGAPMRTASSWDGLIGKLLADVTDTLRFHYPHAVVETTPNTYAIPPTRRRDRIRVLFDVSSGRVTHIMLG